MLLFALPVGTWKSLGSLLNFHKVVAKLPWGAVIIYGARFAMKACWDVSAFTCIQCAVLNKLLFIHTVHTVRRAP